MGRRGRARTSGVHEAYRQFGNGETLARNLVTLAGGFFVAFLLLPFLRDATFVESGVISLVFFTAFAALMIVVSTNRVVVTPSQVRVRRAGRTTVIPRAEVAEVVHAKNLMVMGTIQGYVGILDHNGRARWRTPDNYWDVATIKALRAVAEKSTVVDVLTPEEARTRWPGLLPWSLARPVRAFWTTVLGFVGLSGLVIVGAVLLLG